MVNTNQLTKKKRIEYFDLLRIVAIFFVILIHCSGPLFVSLQIDSYSWLTTCLFESVSRWAVPIFIMVSGSIHLSRNRNFKLFFKKNILKLIIILVFWNFIYAIFETIKNPSLSTFIYNFISGHYHFWFLYMLLGLYSITPILKSFLKSEKRILFFLLLSFLFGIAIPFLTDILTTLPEPFNILGSSLSNVSKNTGFGSLLGYSFFYVLGYFLYHKKITIKTRIIIYYIGLIGIIITFLATWIFSNITQSQTAIFLKDLTINNVFISISVFTFAKYHPIKNSISRGLIRISKYSLGIYVVHLLILENLLILLPHMPAFLEIPVKTILCFSISLLLTFCLRKIPLIKKTI